MDGIPDDNLRVKIDKLAGFVAKNGKEFELLVIQKQKDNAEFLFLTGGPYFQYYKEKVLEYSENNSVKRPVESFDTPSKCLPSISNEEEINKNAKALDQIKNSIEFTYHNPTKFNVKHIRKLIFYYCDSLGKFRDLLEKLTNWSISKNCIEYFLLILYIINDSIFHCVRNNDILNAKCLELLFEIINNIFSKAIITKKSDIQKKKLLDLLNFWLGHLPLDRSNKLMIDLCSFETDFKENEPVCNHTSIACHQLPAGLIVNHINLSDCEYDPIDPNLMQMPIPQPPSASLLNSVDLFYSASSNQDGMGWENDGLIHFFAKKAPYIRSFKEKHANDEIAQNLLSEKNNVSICPSFRKFTDYSP